MLLNIKIIDTNDNELLDIEEITSADAPVLTFNGGDDKFTNIMSSVLAFDMLVKDGSDGKFLHLFTGNETRYKVLLNDVTDSENVINIWQGFLFPEQYSEIYKSRTFFVNFTATDGLGQLKNKYLPTEFYSGKQSITHLIAECLKLTGTEFPMYIAPAIVNATVQFEVEKLDLNADIFLNDGEYTSAYEILENCLKTMGACIHQYSGYWYIIGFNRLKDLTINAESYTSNGVYQTNVIINRKSSIATFIGSADITIVPPFKTVAVNWEPNNESDLLPENIVVQKITDDYEVSTVNYWKLNKSSENAYFIFLASKAGESLGIISDTSEVATRYLSIIRSLDLTDENLSQNYISLNNPIFIDAEYDRVAELDLSFEIRMKGSTEITDTYLEELANSLLYEIYLDDEIIMTNAASFSVDNEAYDWELSKDSVVYINGTLSVDGVVVSKNGYLDVRLYPYPDGEPNLDIYLSGITYKKLEININYETKKIYELNRAIDYSLKESIDLEIGASLNDMVTNKLYVSDDVQYSEISIDNDLVNEEIYVILSYREHFVYNGDFASWDFWKTHIIMSEGDFNMIKRYSDKVYIKRQGTGEFVRIEYFEDYVNEEEGYVGISQYEGEGFEVFEYGDELFVIVPAESVTETDRHYLLSTWRTFNYETSDTYLNTLMKVYNNVQPTSIKAINGSLFGLYFPLDVLEFVYNNNSESYRVTNATLNLSDGSTDVTLIQNANENINDYE